MRVLPLVGVILFHAIILASNAVSQVQPPQAQPSQFKSTENITFQKKIIFFGDSLTAGYGLSEDEAYPAIIQNKLLENHLDAVVVNSGVSGDTTAAGLGRLDWSLKVTPDIFVLALGANDGLRGIPPLVTKTNLEKIIDRVRENSPGVKIVLVGMELPTNLGTDYRKNFSAVFPSIAKEKNVEFIPFLLSGVAGDKALNQSDGIHPTAEGQKIVAENVWKVIQKILK